MTANATTGLNFYEKVDMEQNEMFDNLVSVSDDAKKGGVSDYSLADGTQVTGKDAKDLSAEVKKYGAGEYTKVKGKWVSLGSTKGTFWLGISNDQIATKNTIGTQSIALSKKTKKEVAELTRGA